MKKVRNKVKNLTKKRRAVLFCTILSLKFKFQVQDSFLEYLSWTFEG